MTLMDDIQCKMNARVAQSVFHGGGVKVGVDEFEFMCGVRVGTELKFLP